MSAFSASDTFTSTEVLGMRVMATERIRHLCDELSPTADPPYFLDGLEMDGRRDQHVGRIAMLLNFWG